MPLTCPDFARAGRLLQAPPVRFLCHPFFALSGSFFVLSVLFCFSRSRHLHLSVGISAQLVAASLFGLLSFLCASLRFAVNCSQFLFRGRNFDVISVIASQPALYRFKDCL